MLNFRFAKDYLLHRLKAKNRHGVHSPFVYRLIDEVIYDFEDKKVYADIEAQRKALFFDNRIITVTDLGAGSHLDTNRQKKISSLARNPLKARKLAKLLYRLVAEFEPGNIIELGTCLGINTLYLQKAASAAKVYTLEGCRQTAGIAAETLKKASVNEVQLITGNFDDT